MAKFKIVQTPKPLRMESGDDIGIALHILYDTVPPGDAGYDLFDASQLVKAKTEFIELNGNRFVFTIVPHAVGNYWRILAESKN